MNIYELPPVQALLSAASWAVTQLSVLVAPFAGQAAAAVAIVLLTVLVRAALIPVGVSQARAAATRQRLAPKIAELQRRYRKRPEELQRRMMELYASEKASPLQGCLPVLAQSPVLLAIYGIFVQARIGGSPNELLSHDLAGVGLGESLVSAIGASASVAQLLVFAAVIAVIAVVALASRKVLAVPVAPEGQAAGLMRALSFLPLMTAVIGVFVPLAAGLYLATTTAWTLGERLVLKRLIAP
ncbi:YidC/Oxa1 family membrane protein insertase [Microbacterium marinilacus]|uniref:Membrane protein insertase YidC n=1 Tax=Microbacterium marinilacus TaxID=415209 RepID=A0ABP7BJN0_9MICO|nr:YidC/Oxa1 family membrane protein insertase [Microbacterium marinilacus]MBY0688446.1 YidC/Oxa1 family membrane protein insertase [Microbacterium marinilacus]